MTQNQLIIILSFALGAVFISACKKDIILDEYSTIKSENLNIQTSADLHCVFFSNSSLGYVGGRNGVLFKTPNAGISWTDISVDTIYDINEIYFLNLNDGFLATSSGLLGSTDGGVSWIPVINYLVFKDVFFVSNDVGFVAGGGSAGIMYKTIDGGNNWFELALVSWPATIDPLTALYFANENNGYAVGINGINIQTSDGGITWTGYKSGHPSDPDYSAIYYLDTNNGYWVGEEGQLYSTSSRTTVTEIKHDLYSIDFYDSKGLAVGYNSVLKYVNGIWEYTLTSEGKSFKATYYALDFADATNAFAVGANGIITKFKYD